MNRHLLAGLSTLLLPISQYAAAFNTRGSYQRSYLAEAVSDALRLPARSPSLKAPRSPPAKASELDVLAGEPARELVVVDAAVPNKGVFYERIRPGIDVVELAAESDGLEQLQHVLAKYRNLEAVHIVSHAEAGVLRLGNSRIDAATVQDNIGTFAAINGAIKPSGDLLFYGCDLAAGEKGEEFLEILAANTQTDIAASNDVTGNGGQGGDWELEIHKGRIEAQLPFSEKALKDFRSVLLDQTITMDGFPVGYGEPKTATYGAYTARLSLDDGDPDGNSMNCINGYGYGPQCIVDYSGGSTGDKKLYFDFSGGEKFDVTSLYLYTAFYVDQNLRISSDKGDTKDVSVLGDGTGDMVSLNWNGITKLTIEKVNGSDIDFLRIDDITLTNIGPTSDSDATLTAAGIVTEPVGLDTTIDTVGQAVDVFDFTLVDGGTADGLAMTASQIVVNVSGTSTDAERSQITWRLNGPDVNNATGTYNAGADTITFSGLSISVADGGNEIYSINAYYNDITGLTDGHTIILSVDGDTDLTVGASGTQMGTTTPVNNGAGTTIEVEGKSLDFDGANDAAVVADAAFPDLSDSWTIEAWVKPNSLAEHNGIFDIANGGNAGIDLLILSGGRIEANTTYGSNPVTASGVISTGAWQHVALVSDPTHVTDKLRLYVDGVLVPFTSLDGFSGGTFSGDFYIGSRNPGHGTPVWMDGNIDEVRVWNVARTEAEINASMSVEMATQPKPASLVAYYSMNGVGQTLADGSTAGTADGQRGTTAGNDAADPIRSPDSPIFATNLTQTIGFNEGDAGVALNDIVVSGPTGGAITATLTLSDPSAGSLSAGTFGSATSTYNATTGVWTVTGSVSDVNAALAATAFAPETHRDQNVTITTRIRDAADTGPAIGAISLNVTATNDAPTASNLTQTVAYTEDPGGSIALGDVVVTDVDTGDTITATFTASNPAAGSLTTGTFGAATSTYNASTGIWTVTGSVSDVNAALAAVAFTPAANFDQNITVTTRIRDAASTGPADGTISLNVTAVNDAPTDIGLSDNSVLQSATGAGAAVGTLSSSDLDSTTFTYTLVSAATAVSGTCAASTGNGSFQIDGSALEAAGALAGGSYSICIQTSDGGAAYKKGFTITVTDDVRPTATIVVADTALSVGETSAVTITFSEAVSGFDNSDLTVANGTLSAVSSSDGGITWTATLTPAAGVTDATNVITLNDTGVTDAAGNAGTGTTSSNNYAIDSSRPTATIVVADTSLAAGETSGVTFTFSEAVTGFTNADLTIGNGTLSAVSSADGGITWTATLTPPADVTDASNVIALNNTGVTDAGGNAGTGTTDSNNYAIDTARPTATLVVADTALAAGETSGVTITFSEAVTGFTSADLTVGNGTLGAVSSTDGGITWTATLTPTAGVTDATNVITLANTGVTDAAGNTGTGTTDSNNYAVDTTTATATIVVADTELNTGETSLVTITFSEAVSGFANDDLTFANGTLSAVSSSDGGITWTATFTPDPDAYAPTNVITLDNSGVVDGSGNAGVGTTQSNEFIVRTLAMSLLVTSNLDSGDDATSEASLSDDEADGAGLSLREALGWSRAGDTITFDFDDAAAGNQGGTITLNGSELTIAHSNLTIDGELDDDGAADVTISANNASRVVSIDHSLSGIALEGLTLTEGAVPAGGGGGLHIGIGSNVTLRSSNITDCSETDVGGGGVYGTSATLTMIDSTVSGNSSSAFGGGIRIVGAGGMLNLINSTVSGNATSGAGAHGGGIQFGGTGALTSVNSTISGNTAAGATSLGGGLRITSGTAHVYSSTIVGNASTDAGGGVSADGNDTFINTVVAGNTAGAGATAGAGGAPLATGGVADDVSGTIETATNSYFGTTVTITTDNGSLNGQGTDNLLLGNLADNGGHVLTHRPQVGSALIDAGSDAALPADAFDIDGDSDTAEKLPRDAIGNNRISAAVEIGAVEANDRPLASNDTAVTNEDTAVEIDVLANDSDSDGSIDSSSVVLGAAPAHGTAVVNASGSITYTPALNWNGADSFSYSVADDAGGRSDSATVTITINAINDLPVITGTPSSVVNSSTPYVFAPTLSDVDSTTLTVSAANLPGWATLNASTGAITGTPSFADAGTYSGIVLTVSDGVGTSSLPPFAIVVVGTIDLDGDGMSDVFEQTHGLDPSDPSDAGGDLDGDGVSNLDEYLADRDPTVDDYPPVLSSPAPVTIDATGLLTPMPVLTAPSAVDGRDGALTASLSGSRDYLEPGTHILTWHATDAAGNRGETLQAVNVRPLISLARDAITAEGATARVRVMLNGLSPIYPLSVAYQVGGTAGADDHDLVAGSVVFQLGEIEKSIVVQIAKDDVVEGEETLEVALTGEGNFGTQRTHTLRIVETNVAPTIEWVLAQAGRSVRIVTQDRGLVTLSAAVHDVNVDDGHIYEWRLPASMTATNVGDSARMFDPAAMAPGVYRVELTVSDDGAQALSTRSSQVFQIIASAPALSDSEDTDGDGIDDATEGLIDQEGDGQPDYLDATALPNVLNESAGDDGLFLIEGDPEVMLSLGARAMAHGADGAHLTSGEIVGQGDIAPDSIANVGGYFDLTIRDLPETGSSVNVVIPQRQAIPQHPLYRKLINGQWATFVENGANRLASAPGERGVCPPPGSREYRAGLNPGDWCVRLTLEDGGPNDDDGIANGAIEDPGGVGQIANVTSTTRGGGGAIGTPLLLLLLIMAVHRMQRLNLKRAGAAALALAIAVSLPTQVNAEERAGAHAWYVTGTLGYADTQISKSDVQRDFAAHDFDSTVHSVDGDRMAWGVGVGYAIGNRWAVEAGYLDLGEVDVRFDRLATQTNVAQVHPMSGNGATLSGLYRWRIGDRFGVRARLGAFAWDSEYTTRSGNERVDLHNDSGVDLLWGVSAGYDLSSACTLSLELQRVEFDDEPTQLVGLQLRWRLRAFGY